MASSTIQLLSLQILMCVAIHFIIVISQTSLIQRLKISHLVLLGSIFLLCPYQIHTYLAPPLFRMKYFIVRQIKNIKRYWIYCNTGTTSNMSCSDIFGFITLPLILLKEVFQPFLPRGFPPWTSWLYSNLPFQSSAFTKTRHSLAGQQITDQHFQP